VGTTGINTMRGPGGLLIDAGLHRNFKITERVNLQFRAQFYNILNHTVLGNPNTSFTKRTSVGSSGQRHHASVNWV
jgi:hypothetical protein